MGYFQVERLSLGTGDSLEMNLYGELMACSQVRVTLVPEPIDVIGLG